MSDYLTIEEACSEILDRRGLTPKKLGSDFTDSGYRVISAKLITEAGLELDRDNPRFVDQATYKKWMSSPLLEGDVLLTSEAPTGRVAYVKEKKEWCLGQRLFCLRPSEKVSGRYLYYALQSPKVFWELTSRGTGTTVVGIRQSSLREVTIPIPTKEDQKAIAHILGTLDDKIELNQKMNQTLEEIAKAIFKSWFVDFDPVRAKAEGRPTGLPPEISDLFPDELVDSEIGEIPKGWSPSVAGDLFDCLDRKRIPLSGNDRAKRQGSIPYYGATGIIDHVDDHIFDGTYLLIGEDGSVEKEDGTAFSQYVSGKIWVNNHAHVLIGKGSISTEFLYLAFQFVKVSPFVTGAVQLKISQTNLRSIPITSSPTEISVEFQKIIAPMFERRLLLEKENLCLAELRDTLLPKLISGELRIPDAEKFLDEAGI